MKKITCSMPFNQGFGLIELLLAIFLLNTCLMLALPTIKLGMSLKKQARELEGSQILLENLLLEVEQGIKNAQTFWAIDTIKIYQSAKELSNDAKNDSSAISFLLPSALILERDASDIFCLYKNSLSDDELKIIKDATLWIAIDKTNYKIIDLKVKKLKSSSTLCSNNYAFTSLENLDERYSHIVPIKEHYALYLDRENKLRRLSLLSSSKQTLFYEVSDFKIKVLASSKGVNLIEVSTGDIKNKNQKRLFHYGTNEAQSTLDLIL